MNADGSDQSAGAPSSRALLVNRVRSLPSAGRAAVVVEAHLGLVVAEVVRPAAQSIGPPSTPMPPSLPTKRPLTLSVVSFLAAAMSSSTVAGGFTPAA